MTTLRSLSILGLIAGFGLAQAQDMPPVADDVGIVMRVETTTDPLFRIGTQAVLAFDVTRYGPLQRGTYSIAAREQVDALTYERNVWLSPFPGADCRLIDISGETSPPLSAYSLLGGETAVGETAVCRVILRVVGPAPGGVFLFEAHGHMTAQGSLPDPNTSNNDAVLSVSAAVIPPRPVPALTSIAIWLLAAATCLVALHRLHPSFLNRRAKAW